MGQVVRADAIPVWLNRPVMALDDEKPIELIARGDCKRVDQVGCPSPPPTDAVTGRSHEQIGIMVRSFGSRAEAIRAIDASVDE